jgi:hypothetical protein
MSDVTVGDPSGGICHLWRHAIDISNGAPSYWRTGDAIGFCRTAVTLEVHMTSQPLRRRGDRIPDSGAVVLSPRHGSESPVKLIPANL